MGQNRDGDDDGDDDDDDDDATEDHGKAVKVGIFLVEIEPAGRPVLKGTAPPANARIG